MLTRYLTPLTNRTRNAYNADARYGMYLGRLISNILILWILLHIADLFLLHIFGSIAYTYSLLYDVLHKCFPRFTDVAFVALLIIPHVAFILLWSRYIPLNVGAIFLDRVQKKVNKMLRQPGAGWKGIYAWVDKRLYDSYTKELFRQAIISVAITAVFACLYYLLHFFLQDEAYFFNAQLKLSFLLIVALFVQAYIVIKSRERELIPFLKRFLAEQGSAYTLALFRIFIFRYLYYYYHAQMIKGVYWAALPAQMRVSLPFMGWFIQHIPINAELYHGACVLGIVCVSLACVGLFTRWAALIHIPLSIYIIGVPLFYGKLFHLHIWVWFPAIIAFSQCADVLSIDSLIRKYILKKPTPEVWHARYGIPFKMIWLHLGIIYFFAGFIKLKESGLEWALGQSMINQMQVEWVQHYNRLPGIRIDHYPLLAHTSGLLVILFELFYPLLIMCIAGRMIAGVGGVIMHRIIGYLMYIGFEDLQTMYISYINWHRIWLFIKQPQSISNALKPLISADTFTQLLKDIGFKRALVFGIMLYSINLTFGLFRIHSWPFSSYPTYSMLVPSTHKYVYYQPYTAAGTPLDIYKLGKAANYRMEDYTTIEDRINENVIARDTVTMRRNIAKLWGIWKSNVKELQASDTVFVYLRTSPVEPETADSIIENKLIYTFEDKDH